MCSGYKWFTVLLIAGCLDLLIDCFTATLITLTTGLPPLPLLAAFHSVEATDIAELNVLSHCCPRKVTVVLLDLW